MAEVKKEETKKADDKTVDKDLMSKFGEHTGKDVCVHRIRCIFARFFPRAVAVRQRNACLELTSSVTFSMGGCKTGITCDGCEVIPVIGFRYRCTKCKDPQGNLAHDICEDCHNAFQNGKVGDGSVLRLSDERG